MGCLIHCGLCRGTHPFLRRHEDTKRRKFGSLCLRVFRSSCLRVFVSSCVRIFASSGLRVAGSSRLRVFVSSGLWVFGSRRHEDAKTPQLHYISWQPTIRASKLQSFRASGRQGFRAPGHQAKNRASGLQGSTASTMTSKACQLVLALFVGKHSRK